MYSFDASTVKIFDLGGVIINIQPQHTIQQLEALVANKEQLPAIRPEVQDWWFSYEKGECTFESLLQYLNPFFAKPLSLDAFRTLWNDLLLDIPQHRLDTLVAWAQKEPLYLLSNTNEEHIVFINHYLKKQFGVDGLEGIFEDLFLSYELHMRKPGADIYQYALENIPAQPKDLLFFDDTEENVSGSKAAGLEAVWVPQEKNEAFWSYLKTEIQENTKAV